MSKCDKFEALFTFSDEKTLLEHVAQCEDCRKEYENYVIWNFFTNLIQVVGIDKFKIKNCCPYKRFRRDTTHQT